MKIITDDPLKVTIELETPEGQAAFRAGLEDRRQWIRTKETTEMSAFIRDNRTHSQIVVKCGDFYQRVK